MPPSGGATAVTTMPNYLSVQQARWLNNVQPAVLADDSTAELSDSINSMWASTTDTIDISSEIATAATLNPYSGVSSYDPDDALSGIEDRLSGWTDLADDMDPTDVLTAAFEFALSQIDDEIMSDTIVSDAVDAHTARTEPDYQRALSGELMPLLMGRCVMTSAWDDAVASMAISRSADTAQYSASLGLTQQEARIRLAHDIAAMFINALQLQMSINQATVMATADIAKLRIAGMQDQILNDLKFDESESLWNLELFHYGAGMIAAYGGGVPTTKPQTPFDRAMSAITTSGLIGLQVGMVTKSPAIGMIAGGVSVAAGILGSNWK